MYGYHGKLLKVDLSNRKIEYQDLSESDCKKFIGGAGIGTKILYEETGPETDPLAPENQLIAMTGPFTGSSVPSTGRHHIVARSPLTGILGESNVGGSWAVHFKRTGFDGIIVSGKSDSPAYLWIHDDGVEIRDAQHLWGKDSFDAAHQLKNETHKKATAAVIGQAGEKLVKLASIPHIGTSVRAAARTGMGAVMGSKNLKAIVVYGTRKITQADPEGLKASLKLIRPHLKEATKTFGKFGTAGGVENYEKLGNFPLKNWRQGRWDNIGKISGFSMYDTILTGRTACHSCAIACGRLIKISEGPYAPLEGEGPEYESIGTLGGECLVDDLSAICKANELCNRYGLDTISVGATIAFAMEAYERKILTKKDTDGVELTWGNSDALIEMIHKIGRREGIGELMGEGSCKMAKAIGQNSVEFAVHVKGLEPSAHDPRRFWSQGLSYATAARGACHNASWGHAYELALNMPEIGIPEAQESYTIDGMAEMTAKLQNMMCMQDALIICRFTQVGKGVDVNNMVDWLNRITGWEMDVPEFMETGERIFNLKRLYNTRIGISRKDDCLPPRFTSLERTGKELTNKLPPIGQLLSDYYDFRDWSETGIPTQNKMKALGLDEI
ncbi:MAG: hypothetical protein B6I32_04090 [Desulfobacterium sp. 4572_20]|nr:MAG: hypothetical protein B6I32_04090 [Desulfobacterium sp. 4572_20]